MDELLGKKIPYSSQAEQAVIGSMLIDPRCIAEVVKKLRADEFYIRANRDVYETILAMFSYGQTVDPVTVIDQMKVRGVYDENVPGYLAEIMRITPTSANAMEYVTIIKDRALLRSISTVADEINAMVYEGSGAAEDVLEASEAKLHAVRENRGSGGLREIRHVMQNVFDAMSEAAASGSRIPGLSTGLPDLDDLILGLNKSELVIIAARPGMGKTSIALNIALHVAMTQHKKVAIFSLEMSREQLVTRLLSRAALVPSQNLFTGRLTDQQWRDVAAAANTLSASDILIDDNSTLTVADMNAQCRTIKDLDLVVIDYLQLMSSAGGRGFSNESRTQAVSDISRMMKVMAKQLGVPVICLSQLNRAAEARQDKRPLLSDLRESGSIEQDADVVIGLYREGYNNRECENPNLAEAIVLKNRKGQTGTVNLTWVPEYTSFYSVEKYRDNET
ncbi:MAG: replicative DNA helicase [Oscillospiraceae bacterium]|nr:replicative DNA helicase [Oscillospiraceae bacterium]